MSIRFQRAVVLGVVLLVACSIPAAAQSAVNNVITGDVSTPVGTTFANFVFGISPNLPRNRVPVALRIPGAIISNGDLALVGWEDNSLHGEYAFAMEMTSATINDGSFVIRQALPADSVVIISGTQATNQVPKTFFNFADLSFTHNLSMQIRNTITTYNSDDSIDRPIILLGGNRYPAAVDFYSALQVLGLRSTMGSCAVQLTTGTSLSSVPFVNDHAVVSLFSASACGLSKGFLCYDALVVTNKSMVRVLNSATRKCTTPFAARSLKAIVFNEIGVLTVSSNSLYVVRNIVAPSSSAAETAAISMAPSNSVITNSVVTFQNITTKQFCETCRMEGFVTADSTSRVYAGAWVLGGVPTNDFVGNGLGESTLRTPTQVNANSVVAKTGSCAPTMCVPGNYGSYGGNAPNIGCACPCVNTAAGITYAPSCIERYDPVANYADCADPYCVVCPNDAYCERCVPNFRPVNGVCMPIPCQAANCRQCEADDYNRCALCAVGYGVINGVCYPCADPNCAKCDGNLNMCSDCIMGYVKNAAGRCVSVSSLCQVPNCNICEANNNQRCAQCNDGYGLTSNKQCALCLEPHCARCPTNFRRCEACERGYTLTQYSTCSPGGPCNVPNCYYCDPSDSSKCTGCAPGYVLDTEDHKCYPAGTCRAENCAQCESNSPNRCRVCKEGYRPDQDGRCQWMPGACKVPNCATCVVGNVNMCQTCNTGYSPTGTGQCAITSTRCRVYYCAVCQPGSEVRCQTCYYGYGITTNYLCVRYRDRSQGGDLAKLPVSLVVTLAVLMGSITVMLL